MARIRTIKPELLEDERTATLSHIEWRLFVSCLLLADDYGNFRAAPSRVKGAALWGHPDADVAAALVALGATGLLMFYTVDGQSYAHVKGWDKHQKVDHPGKPACPGPSDPGAVRGPREDSRRPRETLAPDLIGSDLNGSDGKGSEGRGSEAAPAPASESPATAIETWSAHGWLARYKTAWECAVRGGAAFYGDTGDTKACGTLTAELERLPLLVRLAAQAAAPRMFSAFFASEDRRARARKFPFSFFVQEFGTLRAPPDAIPMGKNGSEAIDAVVRATDAKLASERVDQSRLPTAADLAALRPSKLGAAS